jgi:hypothetical protein
LKFAILHHSACGGSLFHYRIDAAGATISELPEGEPGEHRKSIGIVVEGDLDARPPTPVVRAGVSRWPIYASGQNPS